MSVNNKSGSGRLDSVVAAAQQGRVDREQGYRQRALKMYPWICGRCAREFARANVHELTVHHRDHDHDNNPEDGSNWELLCVYCHDNEHTKLLDGNMAQSGPDQTSGAATNKALAGLAQLLKDKNGD